MGTKLDKEYKWIWPFVTVPAPTSQDLNSEMFDRTDHPCAETLVREAIQNSLDARLNPSEPVRMNFMFHEQHSQKCTRFVGPVMDLRQKAGLDIPADWDDKKIKHLLVEDFNTTGLVGDLNRRASDFWNYWLNFGQSNKTGRANLGGRGIGRMTFLIASQIHTVIGYTRRESDGESVICGMALLRAQEENEQFRSTHAHFANEENGSIYKLHDTKKLGTQMQKAFHFTGYDSEFSSGLALIIPYPNGSLTPSSIMAATIENFAPAILNRTLVINSGAFHLNHNSIEKISVQVKDNFISFAIKQDPLRYLQLVQQGLNRRVSHVITIKNSTYRKKEFETLRNSEEIQEIQEYLKSGYSEHQAAKIIELQFPLKRKGTECYVNLRAVIAATPSHAPSFDRLFREGMSLPDVYARNPGGLDLIILATNKTLVEYLNLCEGKAHLDLLESEDVKNKLKQNGFDGVGVRRLVKFLPGELRQLLTPNITEPDPNVLLDFFSISILELELPPGSPLPPPEPPPVPPLPPLPPLEPIAFAVSKIEGGLRIYAKPEAEDLPVNLCIVLAYADGSRRPDVAWDRLDFDLDNLNITHTGIDHIDKNGNRLKVYNCNSNFEISITGFDQNRELDVSIQDN